MIVTLGGRFGGYGLYLLHGKPVFVYNMLDLERFRWEGGPLSHGVLADSLKPGKPPSCSISNMTGLDWVRVEPVCYRRMARRSLARRSLTRFRCS